MRVCIYARHSSEKQCGSTEDQINRCRRWCQDKGYQIEGVFSDEALSGAGLQNRAGIHQLIDMALQSRFEAVITEDLSRLSRDQEDIAAFFKRMQFLGIQIETLHEGVINELHIGLKGTVNALYLKDLADKTRRGMIAAVLKGSIPGGRTFGYDLVAKLGENGEPQRGLRSINKTEAQIVRHVFEAYHQGVTLSKICADLNEKAEPSPRGGRWSPSTLIGVHKRKTGLLRQTLYKGLVTFNKLDYRRNPLTGKRQSIIRPETEWIHVPAPELALLPEQLFDDVQELIDRRSSIALDKKRRRRSMLPEEKAFMARQASRRSRAKQAKARQQPKYIISGNLSCGACGSSITAIRGGVYGCTNKKCDNRNLKRDQIIEETVKALLSYPVSAVKKDIAHLEIQVKKQLSKKGGIERKLRNKQQQLRNLLSVIARSEAGIETRKFVEELEISCQRLQFKITELDHELDKQGWKKPKEANDPEKILQQLHALVLRYRQCPGEMDIVDKLNAVLRRVVVKGDSGVSEQLCVSVELNLGRLELN